MKSRLLLIASYTLVVATSNGTGPGKFDELDRYLAEATAKDSFSGVVLIARNTETVFKKAYGVADKKTNSPNNEETKFNIGSMSKMFTAVAIAQLAEKGRLSFSDTIGKYLPDYPNRAVAGKVTIDQLLTHTSGLGDYLNEKYYASLSRIKNVADILPLFVDEPLAFEPGSKWQYSNAGYVVLGLIIEKVSGRSYFDYVKEEIFKRVGMLNTDSFGKDERVPNMAIGYTRMNPSGAADPSAPRQENLDMRPLKGSPAGGTYSTAEDLLKFAGALRGDKLLSRKFTELVTTGKVEAGGPIGKYGYGFGDKVFNGMHIVGHNGGGPGLGADFEMLPELGYVSVILTNYDPPAMMPVIMKMRELVSHSVP
jgi:D-alanyl-D-alanine carboxypeptidase